MAVATIFRNWASEAYASIQSPDDVNKQARWPHMQSPQVLFSTFLRFFPFVTVDIFAVEVYIRTPRIFSMLSQGFPPFLGVRVGEALNPGPQHHWKLQLRNIVSADCHVHELHKSTDDCIVWSETAATDKMQIWIKKAAAKHGAFCSFSAPADARKLKDKITNGRGASTGTLCYTASVKQVSLHGLWTTDVWHSSRISDSLLHFNRTQVRIISVYGYHSQIEGASGLNDRLFHAVFSQAMAFPTPTIVLGDFNTDVYQFESCQNAVNYGFVDVSAWWHALVHQEPPPTYRGKSRLDYIFCNPQAMRAVKSFSQDPMGYTDHAALFITFDWEQNWNSFKWSFPYDLDSVPGLLQRCAKSQMAPLFPVDAANDCDTNLQAWVLSFESLAETVHEANAGCPLAKPFFGRLKGKRVKVKPSRLTLSSDGDEMVQRQALTYRSQCLRWVRELHHELLKHGSGWGQAHNLWRKILKCKGFDGSFAQWILDNEVASMVPVRVPSVTWLSMVSERLRDEERLWFQAIRLQSINCYKQNMAEDFRKGGRRHAAAVKGGSTAPLHSLAVFRPVEVQRVRVNKGSPARLILKSPVAVAPGDALKLGKTMCQIQACTPEVITLDAPMKHDMYKGAAALVSWSTEPAVVQEQVQTFWKQFWFPEQQPDLQFVQDNIQHMPALAPFDAAISFQPRITSPFAAITYGPFGCVESAFMGPGVAVLVVCIVCFLILAKVDNPMVPADGRPITVLPTLYRLWAKIQTKKVLQSILPWLPQELYGSVPGKSAQEMTLDLQASIEYAVATGSTLTGLSLDLSKAYNTIDRNVLQILARRVGWPNNLICSYMGFLNGLQRHFMAGGSLSESMGSSTGVPEGCPLAVTSMMLVTWLVTSVTKAKTGVVVHSYVDNWSLQHSQLDRPLMEQSKWQSRPTNLLCGFHLRKPTLMPLWQRTADASGAQKLLVVSFPLNILLRT